MKFKDILDIKNNNNNELYIGYNHDKREHFKIDINEYPSIIITGSTGIGKSRLIDQLLLQLVSKYTSLELTIVSIDTTGIELNTYANSKYAPRNNLINAINDIDKAKVSLVRILDLIDERKRMSKEELKSEELIVVAIDDNKSLLNDLDIGNQIEYIMKSIKGLKIFFVFATNYIYNSFFEDNQNVEASYLISFDLADKSDSENVNIRSSNDLLIGEFKVRKGNGKETARELVYNNFESSDEEITELIQKYIKS